MPGFRSAPRRRALLASGAAAALVASGLVVAAPAAHAVDEPVTVNIISFNDFHGRMEKQLPGGPGGGVAALASAWKQPDFPNSIVASAGDNIGASTFTSFIQQDNPTIDTLNMAGVDVSAVGNHEFDRGFADLTDRVIPRAEFPYLGANVYDAETGEPALQEYWITEREGVRVAFIGAVTTELPSLVSPAGIEGLEVRDIPTEINRVAGQLSDGDETNDEAEIVVALVHEGGATADAAEASDPATPLGHIVTGTDANTDLIVTAHTHQKYAHVIDGRPVIQAGQYGEFFQQTQLTYDPATGEVTAGEVYGDPMWELLSGIRSEPRFPDDPAVKAVVDEAVAYASVVGAEPVGEITADLNRGLQPDPANPAATAEARGAESTLGNFVADVQLATARTTAPDTRIAFMNPGGLRDDLTYASSGETDPDGNVTYAEAAAVQPFANTLVTLSLTGDQIRRVLEQQWQPAGASRPFLKLGVSKALTYTTSYAAPAGSRIQNLRLDGEPVDPAASYPVVVNSFLASGGDNFGVFAEGTGRADSGQVDLQGMVDWFAANGSASPDLAQRSIGVSLSPAPAGGYPTGSTIEVALSSLDFTTTETPAGTVDVAIGDVPVGSAAIDRTLVANTDEAGTATLSVVVPDGVSGTVPLRVTTPTGTDIELPVEIAAATADPVASVTYGWPSRFLARTGQSVSYTVVVDPEGDAPAVGTVAILDGSTEIARVELTEADAGRASVELPALDRGLHRLAARFAGSDLVEPSKSRWLPVVVLR